VLYSGGALMHNWVRFLGARPLKKESRMDWVPSEIENYVLKAMYGQEFFYWHQEAKK
jgi:hypothetical protein